MLPLVRDVFVDYYYSNTNMALFIHAREQQRHAAVHALYCFGAVIN